MRRAIAVILLAGSLLVGGCSVRVGDFTAVSTKNIYCENVDVTKLPARRVEGKCVKFWGIGANIQDAVDEALEKGNGNLMIDAVLYRYTVPIPILTWEGWKVKGTVVKVPYAAGASLSRAAETP